MKIAIVGTAPTSVMNAPYDDPTWTIWSLGNNYARNIRFDNWFELHPVEYLKQINVEKAHFQHMKDCGDKLYITGAHPDFPDAKIFPKAELIAKFGKYFTSSIAWQIAFAIYSGAEEIALYGVDMMGDDEYGYQRPCCEFYLGYAIAKGIRVSLAEQSPIMRQIFMYGEEGPQQREFEGRYNEAKQLYEKSQRDVAYYEGVYATAKDIKRRWL